jgi:hypothetical protein
MRRMTRAWCGLALICGTTAAAEVPAPPKADDSTMGEVFLFQAATLAEAKALAESDPAVKAGRLAAEIHPWWVEKRALPEAGAYCRPAVR